MKSWESFFSGVAAILFLMLVVLFLWPTLMVDYTSRARASECLVALAPLKTAITDNAKRNQSMNAAGLGIDARLLRPSGVMDFLHVSSDGVIVVHLAHKKDHVLMTLIPSLEEGQVTWRCLGAPVLDMPSACRGVDQGGPRHPGSNPEDAGEKK